jgi:hypothetical protein
MAQKRSWGSDTNLAGISLEAPEHTARVSEEIQ